MKAFWVWMIDLNLFFRYPKGRCHDNRFCAKMGQNCLPPCTYRFVIRNGIGYRYVNGRVNSANDACILCENFLKFGRVTPELTLLICERQLRHGQKKLAHFSRISPDILDRFSEFFYHMKALYEQMMDLYLIF